MLIAVKVSLKEKVLEPEQELDSTINNLMSTVAIPIFYIPVCDVDKTFLVFL